MQDIPIRPRKIKVQIVRKTTHRTLTWALYASAGWLKWEPLGPEFGGAR